MNEAEASAVVEDAIARSLGKQDEDTPEPKIYSEYEELAKIHIATLNDWVLQLTWFTADQRWDNMDNALLAANQALHKLAGTIQKLKSK